MTSFSEKHRLLAELLGLDPDDPKVWKALAVDEGALDVAAQIDQEEDPNA